MYFLSERRHYVTFHPVGIFRHHWSLIFNVYFLIYFFVYLESGGRFKIWLKFGYEVEFEFEFEFNLEGFLKCFLNPLLMVVSGGSFFLRGLGGVFFGVYKFPAVHFFCSTLSFGRPSELLESIIIYFFAFYRNSTMKRTKS
jgi:hypothetical protein